MTQTSADLAKELSESLAELGAALYDVDCATDTVFVRTQADAGNRPAADVIKALAEAWERYLLAKDAVDRLETAVAARKADVVSDLLGPSAITLAGGTTSAIHPLLEALHIQVADVTNDIGAIAEAARKSLTQLDATRTATDELFVRAGAVDAADDVEIVALREALAKATAAVAADPTQPPDFAALTELVDAARQRVELLEQSRSGLPADLATAWRELDELEALVRAGADGLVLARAKIASDAGLLQPLDLAADGDQSLRPWLTRIQAQADAGQWEGAAGGLDVWRKAAAARRADAEKVARANAAPLTMRNELRGLLEAFRAKAAANGRAEDGHLADLHTAAREALYTAPCQLDQAEALVREYVQAVNSGAGGDR